MACASVRSAWWADLAMEMVPIYLAIFLAINQWSSFSESKFTIETSISSKHYEGVLEYIAYKILHRAYMHQVSAYPRSRHLS